jgi:hypothetical protein
MLPLPQGEGWGEGKGSGALHERVHLFSTMSGGLRLRFDQAPLRLAVLQISRFLALQRLVRSYACEGVDDCLQAATSGAKPRLYRHGYDACAALVSAGVEALAWQVLG